jgi:hypothetical protein
MVSSLSSKFVIKGHINGEFMKVRICDKESYQWWVLEGQCHTNDNLFTKVQDGEFMKVISQAKDKKCDEP